MRSVHAVLLAIILVPCLSAAQETSERPVSSSTDSETLAGKIVKAPGRAVGASARALGRLIKRAPSVAKGEPKPTSTPTTEPAPTSEPAPTTAPAPAPAPEEPTGLTGFVQIQATSTSLGLVTTLDTNIGYNFGQHFGADVGLPLFLVRSPFSPVTNRDYSWTALWGDPYVDLRYRTTRSGLNYLSVLTGTIPVSTPERVFTTGRFGVDWFNHLEGKLGGLTPFLNFGAANGTVNRYYMPRPYSMARPCQTLGLIGDFEGGTDFRIRPGLKIGASVYALLPGGSQTVFSRVVAPGSSVVGDFSHNRYFNHAFQTMSGTYIDPDSGELVGSGDNNLRLTSEIARDNGYSGWLEIGKAQSFTLLLGYTHSVRYSYDAVNVSLNFNATSLLKFLMSPR